MSNIGLFYVGAVLIINGVMLLGGMTGRAAAPLNLFVGAMQVFTPTYLVMTSGGDEGIIFTASGLYLFGFTYLWVAINALADLPGTGLGWFSLFVAVAALGFAWRTAIDGGFVFVVFWTLWSLLWLLFFLVLALGKTQLTRFTGAVAIAEGALTAALPAWLMLIGAFADSIVAAVVVGIVGVIGLVVLFLVTRRRATAESTVEPVVQTVA